MTIYLDYECTIRGKAKDLEEFSKYFEGEYDVKVLGGSIKKGDFDAGMGDGYYTFDNRDYNDYIDRDELFGKFPKLKFVYSEVFTDGGDESHYEIYINGKMVEYGGGNAYEFGGYEDAEERCELCNCIIDYGNELCDECSEFQDAI